jgi:hypothetical protein
VRRRPALDRDLPQDIRSIRRNGICIASSTDNTQWRKFMIEHLLGFPDDVLAFLYRGHITKGDYEGVLVPAVTKALETQKTLRIYCEVKSDFSGLDAGAAWEDLKLGVGHLTRWERVAIVTDIDWIRQAMRFFGFMMPCPMKAFPTSRAAEARAWVTATSGLGESE